MPTQRRQLQIVIPGGSGLLGLILARHFHEQGHAVTVISRYPRPRDWQTVHWTGYDLGPWIEALEGADAVINLAGRSVNCRFTAAHQREIEQSRVLTTKLIGQAIALSSRPPHLWVNASSAAIYRPSFNSPSDEMAAQTNEEPDGAAENTPEKWRFSMGVATAAEQALFAAMTPQTRKIALRSALTMSPESGGAFDTFLRLVRFGLGGTQGSGRQYVSWIHDVDFIRAVEFLIAREDLEGPFNLASPHPVLNRQFMCCLRREWCTSYIGIPLPEPLLAVGAFLLRSETELMLKSHWVIPRRLLEAGFEFHFPNWRGAACDLVTRWRNSRVE
jgi:uncharacterized protein